MKRNLLITLFLTTTLITGCSSFGLNSHHNGDVQIDDILVTEAINDSSQAEEDIDKESVNDTQISTDPQATGKTIHYTDSETSSDVYYSLYMEELSDGTYNTSISIYRITTLEGLAIDNGDGTYTLTDHTFDVTGVIKFENDETAYFTITESSFAYLTVGDEYIFNVNHSEK